MPAPVDSALEPAPSLAARHPRIVGALLLLALHAALLPFVGTGFGLKPEAGYLVAGVTQIGYLVPAAILLLKLGRPEVVKGMLFAALATFIVNAAGCAVLLRQLSNIV